MDKYIHKPKYLGKYSINDIFLVTCKEVDFYSLSSCISFFFLRPVLDYVVTN